MKKDIDAVMIVTSKANAQNLTCFIAFIVAVVMAAMFMVAACILPIIVDATKIICWVSMGLEAAAIGLGFVSYWIKKNALN